MLIAAAAPLWDRTSFDYRVAYLLPRKDHLVARIEENGVDVACLNGKALSSLGAITRLRALCREWQPDILHSHLPATGVMARIAVHGTSHVYTEHNLVHSYRQPTRWLNRITYGMNRAVIAVSEAVAETIESYPGPAPRVIPNGVVVQATSTQAEAARRELGIDSDTRLVVHVGNIRPHKGHSNLIEAIARLGKLRHDVMVVSIGGEKYRDDLERVRKEAAEAGVNDQLRFLGRRTDAQSFLAAADVVVNPADVEGLPVSVLEALALSKPVVATEVGGVPSVIEHGKSGLLVQPGDPQALAEAIDHALTSPDATRWGEEGSRIVADRHGLGAMVAAYEDVYREVLAG